jgi:NADH-quinone oxidoreductase subunit C
MDAGLAELLARVRERFPEGVSEPIEEFGEISVDVARPALVDVATFVRDQYPFELLADLSAVDFLGLRPAEQRFLVAAHLYSFRRNQRLRLRVWIPEGDETCPSLFFVWPTADWQERETFDFFGIRFEGHPDLRRIMMPDDWEGHPQRKDYPLGGNRTDFKHGAFIPPPDVRRQPTTTTGYPGRIS